MKQTTADNQALAAVAARALEFVHDNTIVGLGTGRAATAFVHALGARVKQGLRVRGVPTSQATATLARELGIPVIGLEDAEVIDVTLDGADEVDPQLNLIKGYGGALVREKVVAAASRQEIILVGSEKLVPALGTRGILPVEVVPFALALCQRRLTALGCRPKLRTTTGGQPYLTDQHNYILDCGVDPITDAPGFELAIRAIPGVLGTGLFIDMTTCVLVGEANAVRELRRPS